MDDCVFLIVLWIAFTACIGAASMIMVACGLDLWRMYLGSGVLFVMCCVLALQRLHQEFF